MTKTEQGKNHKPIMLQLGAKKMSLSPDQFRQCVFIIDELVSSYDCHQFMAPVPSTATIYHNKIKRPMDLKTLEGRLFKNKYKTVKDFAKDLFLIWENAMRFHLSVDSIYQQALTLKKRYDEIILFIRGGKRPLYLSTEIADVSSIGRTLIPEELYNGNNEQSNASARSTLYGIHIFSEEDHNSKRMYGGTSQHVFQLLNSYFFEYMNTDESVRKKMPLPRLYIAKNRTLLKQAHTDPNGALAIIYNVQLTPINIKKETLYKIRATVLLAEPVKEVHNVDDSTMDFSESVNYSPKAWIKVKPLQAAVHNVESIINRDIDRSCLKKVFTTFRLSTKYNTDPKKIRNFEVAKYFAQSMLNPVPANSSDIDPKLLERLTSAHAEAATPRSQSRSVSGSAPSSPPPPSSASVTSTSGAVTTSSSVQTATNRTKEKPPAPKLRSRVASNADLQPNKVAIIEQLVTKPKLKLKLSKSKVSASAPAAASSSSKESVRSSKAGTTLSKKKPAPIVIPAESHELTTTAAACLISKLNLKPPKQHNQKEKSSRHTPSKASSLTKKLTINPPKDSNKGNELKQREPTRRKLSNASLSSAPTKGTTSTAEKPRSPKVSNMELSTRQEELSKPKPSTSKEKSSQQRASFPAAIAGQPSNFTPPYPLQHQLPPNVAYGHPPLATYVYANHPRAVYQQASPHVAYHYPQTYPYYPGPLYVPQQGHPLPQSMQVGFSIAPNARIMHNGSVNQSFIPSLPLPRSSSSPSSPSSSSSPSLSPSPSYPMSLPPLQLRLPVQQQNHPTHINVSRAREGHPPLPSSSLFFAVYGQPPNGLICQHEHVLMDREKQLANTKQIIDVEDSDCNSIKSDSTAFYEYSDPEDEDDESYFQNGITRKHKQEEKEQEKEEKKEKEKAEIEENELEDGEDGDEDEDDEDDDDDESDDDSEYEEEEEEEEEELPAVPIKPSVRSINVSIPSKCAKKTIKPVATINTHSSKIHETNPAKSFTRYMDHFESQRLTEAFIRAATVAWTKIATFAKEKQVPVINIHQYDYDMALVRHRGLKSTFYLPNDDSKLIETFGGMTIIQRINEVVGLLQLAKLPHMPSIYELLHDDKKEIVGLCRQRFEKTLKEYISTYATPYQKLDIVVQMIEATLILHEIGLAHRDLSDTNFMVNETNTTLKDGSRKAELWLINFRRAVFIRSSDYKDWWIKCPQSINPEYNAEVVPKSKHDLELWCKALPAIQSKPVHVNYQYHPIETLPKDALDNETLPYQVYPVEEDLYTLGMLIWKVILGKDPWASLEKNHLSALRPIIETDAAIEKVLSYEIPASTSRQLILKLVKVHGKKRASAKEVLTWISMFPIEEALISEWREMSKNIGYKRSLPESTKDGDILNKKQKV